MIGVALGSVLAAHNGIIEARIVTVPIGTGARIVMRDGRVVAARVTAVHAERVTLTPLGDIEGIAAGDRIEADSSGIAVPGGVALLGRAIDATGFALDGGGVPAGPPLRLHRRSPLPGERRAVREMFCTGVPAIDGPLAFGRGARIGIFGDPGCGKSTLLETIVAGSQADASVVALVGERGREAQRWLQTLGPRTTLVCATSDRSAAERVRAAEVAFAQAEALRRRGLHVLLVLDSLARVAAAARDVALATGEPVGRGGYPPSVFALLAGLLERAGSFADGSITLVATVLSDGADERDPVSEACRAALDGHLRLSPRLAARGWFPAIDLPASTSRTTTDVVDAEHAAGARTLRNAVSILDETRDARGLGLDPSAGDPAIRRAVDAEEAVAAFLRGPGPCDLPTTLKEMARLTDMLTDGYLR